MTSAGEIRLLKSISSIPVITLCIAGVSSILE